MLATIIFFILFCIASPSLGMTEAEVSDSVVRLLKYNPRHKLRRKPAELARFSSAILRAAERANVKPAAIIATAYLESTFRASTKGLIGERGLMQLHGKAQWSYCRLMENRKIDRQLLEDQLVCGAHWLRMSIDQCDGTYYQGFAGYMTKRTCKPRRRTRLQSVVLRRLKLMFHIQNGTIHLFHKNNDAKGRN